MSKFSVVVEKFTPRRSNTLVGFLTVTIPEMRLRISDLTAHESHGKRWVGLPAKPQVGRDGTVRKGDNGKALYVPVLEFVDRETRDAFSARVIAALIAFAPGAFEGEEIGV